MPQERNYSISNYNDEKEYILEFSSNFPDIDLIFNDSYCIVKKKDNNNELGFVRYFIVMSKNSNSYFIVRVNNTITEKNIDQINYILRLNDNLESIDYDIILNKEYKFKPLSDEYDKYADFNLVFKNGKNQIISNNSKYIYYLKFGRKDNLIHNETLNKTMAIIENEPIFTQELYQEISNIVSPDIEMEYNISHLEIKQYYIAIFFIVVKTDKTENYYSRVIELYTKEKEEKKNNTFLWTIISISIPIVVIIIIFIFIYLKLRNKNKLLVQKIQTISFAKGVDDCFEYNKSKTDKNYDIPFI